MNRFLRGIRRPNLLCNYLIKKISWLFADKIYLRLRFYFELGYWLDFNNPKTFSEKLQWLKLYDRRPEYTIMVDKIEVKKYVAEKLGPEYIISTLGFWNTPDDIDFEALPNQFVLKCNHNSGGLYLCRDKSTMDVEAVKKKLRKSLRQNYYWLGREWPYKNVKRRILAEEYMIDENKKELVDYKFFCFHGTPMLCQVISDRSEDEKIDFYDMNWKRQNGLIGLSYNVRNAEVAMPSPHSFEQMKRNAAILSCDIPFSRIDFYEINGRCYFGEITLYPNAGFGKFRPNEWNEEIGKWLKLPSLKNNRVKGEVVN